MMNTSNLDVSMASLRHAYAQGSLTPEDVVSECFRRVRAYADPHVWTELVDERQARARARELMSDPSARQLPLYGIPFSVKDNVDVAGMATTCGCRGFDRHPEQSAYAVAQALRAGAILIGKNTLDQFATGLNGTRSLDGYCRNAFDPRYVPGGSSSGSGVAVSASLVSFSLGSDTGGSGRVPAAMNNVVGVKPTLGLVSMQGMVKNNRYFDCMPVFSRTVEDGYAVLSVIRGYDPDDSFSRTDADDIALTPDAPGQFVFGVPRESQLAFFGDELARRAYEEAIERLAGIGGVPREIDYSLFQEAARLPFDSGLLAERAYSYGQVLRERADTVHPAVAAMLEKGLAYSGREVVEAVYALYNLRRAARRLFVEAGLDVIATPTVGRAYRCEELEQDPIALNHSIGYYTYAVNPLDLSALAVPSAIRSDGLPFGISLLAPAGADGLLHGLGMRFQAATGLPAGTLARRS